MINKQLLLTTMTNDLIESKLCKGFTRLKDGLFEDCIGCKFHLKIKESEVVNVDGIVTNVISIRMVSINA